MKVNLSKKEAKLMLACVLEIHQSSHWYNEDAGEVCAKTPEGMTAVGELVRKLEDQDIESTWDDEIWDKHVPAVEAERGVVVSLARYFL